MPERQWLYGFSTAHIQRYLLDSPRLRDIQGGSQLLEGLCNEVFWEALDAVGLPPEAVVSSAAAGVRLVSTDERGIRRLVAIWPFVADARVPGARVHQAVTEVDAQKGLVAAQREVGERLHAARSHPRAELPVCGPLIERYRRTGRPAVAEQQLARGESPERVDRETESKGEAWRSLQTEARSGVSDLDHRFLPAGMGVRFASGRDAVAEGLASEEAPYVGVIHADGNGVGRFIETLFARRSGEEDARLFERFSAALLEATKKAAKEAVEQSLAPHATTPENAKPTLPARPVVLGGDDLTIIVKGECAIHFTSTFLEAFERHTAEGFAELGMQGLTACAGVAIVKHTFPFDRAHELAETLCRQAKTRAHSSAVSAGSAVAFHRVTTSLPGDATAVARELTQAGRRLTLEAYGVGGGSAELPELASLQALAGALQHAPRGPVRKLLATLQRAPARADAAYERMLEVWQRTSPHGKRNAEALERALSALGTTPEHPLWTTPGASEIVRTPLLDAHVLREVSGTERES